MQDLQIRFVLEVPVYRVGNDSERNRDHDIGTYDADYLYIFSRGIKT